MPAWSVQPCGDRCLVVVFDERDVARSNAAACELARLLIEARLPGVSDIVPSMAGVGVHYDPATLVLNRPSAHAWDILARQVEAVIGEVRITGGTATREVVIPVCYGGEYGEDLEDVARQCKLTQDEVIAIHSGSSVSVLMLGFAPGHPYIGMFDKRLQIGRRTTPRTAVPRGSIGLANRQTVIYPSVIPGGWSLIGRTPLSMFSAHREIPCLLNAGDRIRFKPITREEFIALEAQEAQP
ncbi:5-oxoprolinase subunit PxpB [Bordetella sp. 15P40C-2]|nr:5-oxoprolinase subunit PxpB [Bordetella sp. 15P40C-2]MVW72326.1 5-oxoprolinase subunit PxpB [Bordetella sp. 15P40C-2]